MVKHSKIYIAFFLLLLVLLLPNLAFSLEKPGENLEDVGIAAVRGKQLDLNLRFTDTAGETHSLGDLLLPDKPTIIVPAYYDCPRLCGLLLDGVKEVVQKLGLRVGQDYRILTVSFDPSDTVDNAQERFTQFTSKWDEELGAKDNWLFLIGEQNQTHALMDSLGFHFKEDKGEFAHSAAIFIVTPAGILSQYFTDVRFSARDVRLAMVEAGKGSIGGVLDQVLLFCFRFDPSKGKYTWAAFNLMRAGAGLTFVLLAGMIFWLRRKEKAGKGLV